LRAELERIDKGLPTTERIAPERKPFTSKEITVKFQSKKLIIPALAVAAVIAAAIIFWPKKVSNLDPNLVAVAVFENKTGDPKLDYIGSMAAERIMQGLEEIRQFPVAPMPSAEALSSGSRERDKLRGLAEVTGAGKIVHGDYYLQGETIQFHAWVQDVIERKNIISLDPASGPVADPAAALEPLRLKLMGGLAGFFEPIIKDFVSVLKEPLNIEAYKECLEGGKAFMRSEYPKAIEHFLRAAENDPNIHIAIIQAAIAHLNQGQYAKADELAQKVEKSRADLTSAERLLLDWLQASLRGDRETALRSHRQLASTQTGWIWNYRNAYSATYSNYPQEAVDRLDRLDPYDEIWKDWSPHYWNVLTTAHHMLGNHKRELKEARRGREQFSEILSMLTNEVRAAAALGRTEELQKLFEDSQRFPPQRGYSPGIIMLGAGRELRAHGFKEDAVRVLSRALEWFQSRPNEEKDSVEYQYYRAITFFVLGKWAEAKAIFEKIHSDVPDSIAYLGYMGAIAAYTGDKEEAVKVSKQLEEDKRLYLFGNPTYWQARIAAVLGEKEGAVNLLRRAIKQGFAYSSIHPTEDFESLADFPPYIQLINPKG